MTTQEAIKIVRDKAALRTRYEGQSAFLDEVLLAEIDRQATLIQELKQLEIERLTDLSSATELIEVLDNLERLVLSIPIDNDNKEQFQKDCVPELLNDIKQTHSTEIDKPIILQLVASIQGLLRSISRDTRRV
jgi:uncharacterized secreted protein with C-terminal beta-propeller domain